MADKVQLNLRVERRIADRLRAFAEVVDTNMATIVEEALVDRFEKLQADPTFQAKAEQWAQRQRDLLGAVVTGDE